MSRKKSNTLLLSRESRNTPKAKLVEKVETYLNWVEQNRTFFVGSRKSEYTNIW